MKTAVNKIHTNEKLITETDGKVYRFDGKEWIEGTFKINNFNHYKLNNTVTSEGEEFDDGLYPYTNDTVYSTYDCVSFYEAGMPETKYYMCLKDHTSNDIDDILINDIITLDTAESTITKNNYSSTISATVDREKYTGSAGVYPTIVITPYNTENENYQPITNDGKTESLSITLPFENSFYYSITMPHFKPINGLVKITNTEENPSINNRNFILQPELCTVSLNTNVPTSSCRITYDGITDYTSTIKVNYGETIQYEIITDEYRSESGSIQVWDNITKNFILVWTPSNPDLITSDKPNDYIIQTYSPAVFNLTLVGGGGGAGGFGGIDNFRNNAGSGGGGAAYVGEIALPAGDFLIHIGSGGNGSGFARDGAVASSGDTSYIKCVTSRSDSSDFPIIVPSGQIIIEAGGGGGGQCTWKKKFGYAPGGAGGKINNIWRQILSSLCPNIQIEQNGHNGDQGQPSSYGGESLISGTTYGKGGDGIKRTRPGMKGYNGYAELKWVRPWGV